MKILIFRLLLCNCRAHDNKELEALSTTAVHQYAQYIPSSFPQTPFESSECTEHTKGQQRSGFQVEMFLLTPECAFLLNLQHSDAPVFSSPLPSRLETRQADEGHGGRDGQRSDVLQQDPGQTQRSDTHLDQGRDDDGPLDLTEWRKCRNRKKGNETKK